MKLKINRPGAVTQECDVSSDPTVSELRHAVSKSVGKEWHTISLSLKMTIFIVSVILRLDTDKDIKLSTLLAKERENLALPEVIYIHVRDIDLYEFEGAIYNPAGLSFESMKQLLTGQINDKFIKHIYSDDLRLNFVRRIVAHLENPSRKSYEERFQRLHVMIPESFRDPKTKKIMNDPVLAKDQCVYDSETLKDSPDSIIKRSMKVIADMELFLDLVEMKNRIEEINLHSSDSDFAQVFEDINNMRVISQSGLTPYKDIESIWIEHPEKFIYSNFFLSKLLPETLDTQVLVQLFDDFKEKARQYKVTDEDYMWKLALRRFAEHFQNVSVSQTPTQELHLYRSFTELSEKAVEPVGTPLEYSSGDAAPKHPK